MSSFQKVFNNTLISALAFGVVGVIGLLLVPVMVTTWGLALYGLITLARALIPGGLLGVFDPGLSEQATQAVSRARVDGDWTCAGREVGALLAIAVLVGVAVALSLVIAAPWVATLLRSGEAAPAFTTVLQVTGLAACLLFPALVADGLVKGFEDFRSLRTADVVTTALFAAVVVWLAHSDQSFDRVAYAALAALGLRSAAMTLASYVHGRRHGLRVRVAGRAEVLAAWRYGRHLAASRAMTTLRDYAAAPTIGALLGPAAVGIYDIVMRLPRFLKVVLSLLNNTLLPLASRLTHDSDRHRLTRMATSGMALSAALAAPLCATGMWLAEPILRLWIAPDLARYAPWLASMFAVPLVNSLAGMLTVTLIPQASALAQFNALVLAQTVAFFSIGALLAASLGERAFIAAYVATVVAAFPWQIAIARRHLDLSARALRPALTIAAACLTAALVLWSALHASPDGTTVIATPWALVFSAASSSFLMFTLAILLLPTALRQRVLQAALRQEPSPRP